jgi:hypothetical protein
MFSVKTVFFNCKSILVYVLISISSTFIQAQVRFQKVYAPNGDVAAKVILQTSDKEYLIFTSVGAMLKIDSNGTIVKGIEYSISNFSHQVLSDHPVISDLIRTTDGGYIITFQSGVIRLAANESVAWTKQYSGVNIKDVKQTADGGYIFCGNVKNNTRQDISLFKTDANGAVTWYKTYGGSLDDIAISLDLTADGGYIIAGNTKSFGGGGQDGFMMKTDNAGKAEWARTYGNSSDDAFAKVISLPGGGYALCGYGHDRALLVKTNATGKVLWAKGMDSSGGFKLARFKDGGFLMGGGVVEAKTTSFLSRFDSTGSVKWTKRYVFDQFYDLKLTSDGGSVMTGGITFKNQGVYVSKMDAGGNNGCVLPVLTVNFTTDSMASAAQIFPETGINIYDSAWTVTASTLPAIKDTVLCVAISAIHEPKNVIPFSIFPNPATGAVTLNYPFDFAGSNELCIYNIAGKPVLQKIMNHADNILNISNLPKGMYLVRLNTRVGIIQQKLIVE